MSTNSDAPAFSLSAYEQTKQRMKQLALEQKRAAAATAASSVTVEPSAPEAGNSTTAANDRIPEVPARSTTRGGVSRPLTRDNGASKATSSAAAASARGAARLTPGVAAEPVATRSSLRPSFTLPSSTTLVRPSAVSSYSPLSPRTSSATTNGWTNERTAPSVQQQALSVNRDTSSPRRMDSTSAPNELQATAPFSIASVSPATSLPTSPKTSATDPFQPIAIAVPTPSTAFTQELTDERAHFQVKLDAVSNALLSTAQSLGLKYSLDARLKSLLHELDAAHAASLRAASEQVARVRSEWATAASALQDARSRYELELARAKATLAERQRKMDRLHSASVARAVKEAESVLRGEYLEKSKRFEGIEKYNTEKLRSLEDTIRQQVKTSMALDARKTRAAEIALQEKLEKLEREGLQLVQAKAAEIETLKKQSVEQAARLRESQHREKTWERKFEKLAQERRTTSDDAASLRVQLAQAEAEKQTLAHQLEHAKEAAQIAEREAMTQASQLANRVLEVVKEADDLKTQLEQTRRQADQAQQQSHDALASLKAKHAHELDTIQTRISGVLRKKDDQIAELKHQLEHQIERVRDIEHEIGGI